MGKGIYQILHFNSVRNYFCVSASKSTCIWVGVFAFGILPACDENRTSRHCFAEVREECRHSGRSHPERPLMSECSPHICRAQSVWDTPTTSRTPEKQLLFFSCLEAHTASALGSLQAFSRLSGESPWVLVFQGCSGFQVCEQTLPGHF